MPLSYFMFSSRRRHTRWPRDWSSDVCSSDLDFSQTFKTITVDNGTEFLDVETLETSIKNTEEPRTNVYYCHPYASYERGSNEQMHTLIRRFIPKGSDISQYSKDQIKEIEQWINNYPRRLLDSHSSMHLLRQEVSADVFKVLEQSA